jgi:hypothetical protein
MLVDNIRASGGPDIKWADAARSNATVADAADSGQPTYVGALISDAVTRFPYPINNPDTVSTVLMNWGANEMSGGNGLDDPAQLPSAATWNANYLAIIDYVHGRFPNALIYIMYPWRRGYDSQAAELHASIDTIRAARAGLVFASADEAVWLKAGDNGNTNSADGVHYSSPEHPSNINGSTTGGAACASALQPAIGY